MVETLGLKLRDWVAALGSGEGAPQSALEQQSFGNDATHGRSGGLQRCNEVEQYPPPALEGRVYVDCGFYGFYVSNQEYAELQSSAHPGDANCNNHADQQLCKVRSFKLGVNKKPGFPGSIIGKHGPAPAMFLGKHGQESTVRRR